MRRIFIDTNILIDFLARRGQFFNPAGGVISRSKKDDYEAAQIPIYEPQEFLDMLTKN